MTDEQEIQIYRDALDMKQTSKGFGHLSNYINNEIMDSQDAFLNCKTDAERFEKQIRLKTLVEIRGWADEAISRGRSREAVHGMKKTTTLTGSFRENQ